MLNFLRSAASKIASGRAGAGAVLTDMSRQATYRGTNMLRGGMQEIIRPSGQFVAKTRQLYRPTIHNTWAKAGTEEVMKRMPGVVGQGLIHVAPRLGAASLIDEYLETPAGQELSGAARFGLSAVGFGLRVGAYRHAARGIAGTGFSMMGRMTGDANRFAGAYKSVHKATGNMFQKGALTNLALRGSFGLGKEVVKFPFRAIVGAPHALGATIRGTSRLIGSAGEMWGGGLRGLAGNRPGVFNATLRGLGNAASGVGRVGGAAGHAPFGAIMTPRFTTSKGVNTFFSKWYGGGLLNKEGHAPIMSGFMALGMGANFAYTQMRSQSTPYHMRGLDPLSNSGIRPSYYGAGVHAMRRGAARNYGPSLTLQLHRGHSRVMP